MLYIPILKNRTVEMNVLEEFTKKKLWGPYIIPLIELVQEKTKTNAKNTSLDEIKELLKENRQQLFIDFFRSTKLNNTQKSIQEYLNKVNRQSGFYITELMQLQEVSEQIVPVISYLSELSTAEINNKLKNDFCQLHQHFIKIALRIQASTFLDCIPVLENLLDKNSYLLIDIGTAPYSNPVFKPVWNAAENLKREKNCTTIVLNDNRPSNLYNKDLKDKSPIPEIDNGLRDYYLQIHCDGFGDYAGITSSLPTNGGRISPAGIYYSKDNNCFISFVGRAAQLSEFSEYIAPSIVESKYWNEFSVNHHKFCPGCQKIEKITTPTDPYTGKSQAIWKGITMSHYIYTMNEYAKENSH